MRDRERSRAERCICLGLGSCGTATASSACACTTTASFPFRSGSPSPTAVHPGEIRFDTLLPAGEVVQWDLTISCEVDRRIRCDLSYEHALVEVERALHSARADDCLIVTSNERFNVWLNRSLADLHMMISDTPD